MLRTPFSRRSVDCPQMRLAFLLALLIASLGGWVLWSDGSVGPERGTGSDNTDAVGREIAPDLIDREDRAALPTGKSGRRAAVIQGSAQQDLWDGPSDRAGLIVVVMRGGVPYEGARISLRGALDAAVANEVGSELKETGQVATTDADGSTRFFVKPNTQVTIAVTLDELKWSTELKTKVLSAGHERTVTFIAPPEFREVAVDLIVTSEADSRPLAAVRVTSERSAPRKPLALLTDHEGGLHATFEIGERIRVERSGYAERDLQVPKLSPGEPWRIALRPTAKLFGSINVDLNTQVTERMTVRISLPQHSRGYETSWRSNPDLKLLPSIHGERLGVVETLVSPDGTWSVDNLELPSSGPTEGLEVRLMGPMTGHLRSRVLMSNLTVRPGDSILVQDPLTGGSEWTIEFRYKESDKPLGPGVVITLTPEASLGFGKSAVVATTDENGCVRFGAIANGEWSYLVASPFGHTTPGQFGKIDHTHRQRSEALVGGFGAIDLVVEVTNEGDRSLQTTGSGDRHESIAVLATAEQVARNTKQSVNSAYRFDMVPLDLVVEFTALPPTPPTTTLAPASGTPAVEPTAVTYAGSIHAKANDRSVVLKVRRQ